MESRLQSVADRQEVRSEYGLESPSVLFVRGKRKNRDGRVLFVGFKDEHWGVRGNSQTRRERKGVIMHYVGGVDFAGTGEGISQKPEKGDHLSSGMRGELAWPDTDKNK